MAPNGFALPAVLTVTGVVTLIFLVALSALESLTREAAEARARVDFAARAMRAEARTTYLLATEPLGSQALFVGAPRLIDDLGILEDDSAEGVRRLWIDGRPHEDETVRVRIALQDAAGQLNLATLSPAGFVRLGAELGLEPEEAERLHARLQDYVDRDDERRPNGGESRDYRQGAAPAQQHLRTPDELLSVLGVREQVNPDAWRRLRDGLAYDPIRSQLNVNTATSVLLRVELGLTTAQTEAVLIARAAGPFRSLAEFVSSVAGADPVLDDEDVTSPAPVFTLTVWDDLSRSRYRARLFLTPNGDRRPFWIDHREFSREEQGIERAEDVADFPHAPR